MITKVQIKELAFKNSVDLIGFAAIDRFDNAPEGFHPKDVYSKTETVIVFAIRIAGESMYAENPVPYTYIDTLAKQKMDSISYEISTSLDKLGLKNVLIPTDDPYLCWNQEKQDGRAILSLRHAGLMAGLGKLGRNNLLINKDYGSLIQIGALLTKEKFESDPLANYDVCPTNCRICIDSCPQRALTGETIIQKECRLLSNFKNERGHTIVQCFECRKKCPRVFGIKTI